MNMKILIAVDGSSFSSEVVEIVALCRFWQDGTELRLLTVVEPAPISEHQEQFEHQSRMILMERVNRLKAALPSCSIVGTVQVGDPAATIVDVAKEWPADLIVIGSHGDAGVKRLHPGSVAANVVNDAPCSVEVIKLNTDRSTKKRSLSSLSS